ncbi:hypothetical protein FRC14_006950 [Serendipita sp. 396]|nr:hypothetical protein FRC14_006950 [Serendipita sp. 396]
MPAINGTNTTPTRPLRPGVWAPIPTFFLPNSQDLDIPTLKKHVIHIAHANIGILLCGSMGEAHHLSPEERILVITSAREALDSAGLHSIPIIAGTGAGSTRETIKLSKEAAQAGADYSIVIPSGYFTGALASDRAALKTFFKEVSEASPIPVMIYNYPGASGGIDMDSDLIEEMAMELPNVCGVKLTCGNGIVARADRTVAVTGIAGTKWMMEKRYGYGGVCRRPLSPLSNQAGETLLVHRHVTDIERLEKEIEMQKGLERKHLKNGVTIPNGNGVTKTATNGVSVSSTTPSPSGNSAFSSTSNASSSPETPTTSDAPSPVLSSSPVTATAAALGKKTKGAHSRSGSLTSSIRSLVGSRKGKKTVV